jgi:hypothetical protein
VGRGLLLSRAEIPPKRDCSPGNTQIQFRLAGALLATGQ